MSHLKEREEKNCLNCNAIVHGRFCHICGQENVVTKESVWHLINHFFQDITHFDGKFFTALKYIIFRPGFLSHEYMVGRRASYLNPIRMYVFVSFVFFLVFFNIFKYEPKPKIETTVDTGTQKMKLSEIKKMNAVEYKNFIDGVVKNDSTMSFAYDSAKYFKYHDSIALKPTTIRISPTKYTSRQQYDSALANGKKHNWVERQIVYQQIGVNEKFHGDGKAFMGALMDKLMHTLPQLLFISLPLFALILKLLYIRRKKYYYVNHAVFTIHLFVFVFIALLFVFSINKIADATGYYWLAYLNTATILGLFFYNYKAMRNFYQQKRLKTILKFCILHIINFIFVAFLFIGAMIFSLFKI